MRRRYKFIVNNIFNIFIDDENLAKKTRRGFARPLKQTWNNRSTAAAAVIHSSISTQPASTTATTPTAPPPTAAVVIYLVTGTTSHTISLAAYKIRGPTYRIYTTHEKRLPASICCASTSEKPGVSRCGTMCHVFWAVWVSQV